MIIKNQANRCYHCKRSQATHIYKHGQIELRVCRKCGVELNKMYARAELIPLAKKKEVTGEVN